MPQPTSRRRLRRASLVAGALIAALVGTQAPALATPPDHSAADRADHRGQGKNRLARKLVRQVTVGEVNRHLIAFQRIADRTDGNRAADTAGYDQSVQYVRDTLTRAGYVVQVEDFDYEVTVTVAASVTETAPVPRDLSIEVMENSPDTPEGGVTGPLALVPTAADGDATPGCEAADYAGGSFTGAIALIQRGGCTFDQKHRSAADAGAVAALIYNNEDDPDAPIGGTLGPVVGVIPTGEMTRAKGEQLTADAATGQVTVTVDLRTQVEQRVSQNVFAETRTGRRDNVVMLGAHLDGVEAGPGINDNGTGSATLLALAQNLARHKVKNTVRFAWWGAEELGLLGSEAYVASLSFEQQLDIALYLNFDMVGSTNAVRFVYDGDDSDQVGAPAGPFGSAQIEQVFTGFFDRRDLEHRGTDFTGRSDYGPFIAVGIPAGGLFTGADGIKTEEEAEVFGGTPGIQYDPCYHEACDNLGNVDRRMLNTMADGAAWALGRFAIDTSDVNGVGARSRTRVPVTPQADTAEAMAGTVR